jgi:hypothetical protein
MPHKHHKKSHKKHKSHTMQPPTISSIFDKTVHAIHNIEKAQHVHNIKEESLFLSSSDSTTQMSQYPLFNNTQNKNVPVCNSYPLSNMGYNFPNPLYSSQIIRRPDDNQYFRDYKYTYNVQVNKPVLTYENYVTQNALKNMTPEECRYYAKMNEKYYYFNGGYDVPGDKQNIVALQAGLNYPMYSGGPATGEINGQAGYMPQPTRSAPVVNPNDPIILNTNGVQVYANSPDYYGVQAKTLPGQNLYYRNPNNTPNPTTGYNPAYSNYGQYYY